MTEPAQVKPLWRDEFEGDSLDDEKWFVGHWNNRVQDIEFRRQNLEVRDGRLHITLTKNAGGSTDAKYASGAIRSREHFQIGPDTRTEVRAKMISREVNANSAIWIARRAQPDIRNVEIDLQEYTHPDTAPNRIRSALHLWEREADAEKSTDFRYGNVNYDLPDPNLDGEFHTYRVDRDAKAGELRFYFDGGDPYWVMRKAFTDEHPQFLEQDRPIILYVRGIKGKKIVFQKGAKFVVEYVRVYPLHED